MPDTPAGAPAEAAIPPTAAADLQDHLLSASHDLDRLQTLLADACTSLMHSFHGASEQMHGLRGTADPALERASSHLHRAVTALQFQDMASQLIDHTRQRLRSCADRLARDALGDDEDGPAVVREPPARPNPVTQDEMDAGSIELF